MRFPEDYFIISNTFIDAQVKAATVAHAPLVIASEAVEEDILPTPPAETTDHTPQTDPTLAHAALTEIDAVPIASLANGHDDSTTETPATIPQNSGIGEGAANATADSHWDNSADLSTSQEWVDVGRDTAETETGITATIAASANIQSWADDQPEVSKVGVSITNLPWRNSS